MKSPSLDRLEKEIAYSFRNKALIHDALTHSSTGKKTNYERLEFLGDRVLGLVMAQILYDKFPGETEGDLAKRLAALVQGSLLAEIAASIRLGEFIFLSDAERGTGGSAKENILADCFEAMIGAIYLDSGLEYCHALVEKLWSDSLFTMKQPPLHPKTRLQEWAQSGGLPLPLYEIAGQSGPDHAPVFDVKLSVKGFDAVTGSGRSRQDAEKDAARIFLEKLAQGRE